MRVLVILSSVSPTDWVDRQIHGIHNRLDMFIDAIKEIAQIDVLTYVLPDVDISPAAVTKLQNFFCNHWQTSVRIFPCPMLLPDQELSRWQLQGPGVFNFFRQPDYAVTAGPQQIQAFEECLVHQPDAIFIHRLRSACPSMLSSKALPPLFLDLDDIEPILFTRKLRHPPSHPITSLPYYLQIPALWWGTLKAIRQCHQSFVCSEKDRSYLTDFWRLPGIITVPNAASIPNLLPVTAEPSLLLIGSYSYQPNINAANFLIEKVWPSIHLARPDARLIIAGRDPINIRGYNTGVPNVEFTGFVDDLNALYQHVRIVCCPIFSGSGTRAKMVEAAAYGKAIVASQIGAEGLKFEAGIDYLLSNKPEAFAQSCLNLLNNQILCEELGVAARKKAIEYYDFSNIVEFIQDKISIAITSSRKNKHFTNK